MDLVEYISEAISSGKSPRILYQKGFPEVMTMDNFIEWLSYKGYPDITSMDPATQYLLQRKFVGYYEIDFFKQKGVSPVLCIVNGDGKQEYRLFFDPKKGFLLSSAVLVKVFGGKLDVYNIQLDNDSIKALADWLESGEGIRESTSLAEAVSSGKNRSTPWEVMKNGKRFKDDFIQLLDYDGFKYMKVYSITELLRKHGAGRCYTILGNGSADIIAVYIPSENLVVADVYDLFGHSKNVCAEYRMVKGSLKMIPIDIDKLIEFIENA